jgi:RNA polymerase sigma-70 factor (ECF subfamily)
MNPDDARQAAEPEAFPQTLWTMVLQARSTDPEEASHALEQLCTRYHRAVHAWFQRSRPQWLSAARAEEWAQDFMVALHGRNLFARVEQRDSRFRSFLVTCLKNFFRDKLESEAAAKRGGHAVHVDLEETTIADMPQEMSAALDAELALAMHERVMQRMAERWSAKGHRDRFEALAAHLLGLQGDASYPAIAQSLGLNANHVKKIVFDLREAYFDFFRDEVRDIVPDLTALDEEMRYLMGLLARRPAGVEKFS